MAEIIGYIDVAQIVLYAFWLFFAGLLWYLFAENRREGYPLEDDVSCTYNRDAWLALPSPKTFLLPHGHGKRIFPHPSNRDTRPIAAVRTARTPGAPLVPTGNPMIDGVGPAAYCERPDYPDLTPHGTPKIQPLRVATEFRVNPSDTDPRGNPVVAADRRDVGVISDVWVDQTENYIRYFEVTFGDQVRLIPMHFALERARRGLGREYYVHALMSTQFADIPKTKSATEVTLLEEDMIQGYFGGGLLYAEPRRQEPIL